MILASGLPRSLWAEAINTTVYLLNRVTRAKRSLEVNLYEAWTKKKPNLEHLQVFGAEGFVNIPIAFTNKFDPCRAKKIVLVRYKKESYNYKVYDSMTKKVTV